MGELRFYHMTEVPLERALPVMLDRTIDRGGRAVVRGSQPDRLAFLNSLLWTFDDASFLPHGIDGDADAEHQPVWLTTGADLPNHAETLFLIDGAETSADEITKMQVTAVLFDGHDSAAVDAARGQWKSFAVDGQKAVYWAQESGGKWVKKHETDG